jgi:hypothetical protein
MEGIFDILTQCSWYNWDAKNKQTLLIFMANSLKPCLLTFAGYAVDYRLAVAVSSANKFAGNILIKYIYNFKYFCRNYALFLVTEWSFIT